MMIDIDRASDAVSAYEYGCDLRRVFPWKDVHDPAYWGAAIADVRPGEATVWDCHDEMETFIIVAGRGVIEIGDERDSVSEGDVVLIPRNARHRIGNASTTGPLRFISIFWGSPEARKATLDLLREE